MWIFIIAGFAAMVLAHTAPFPFLLEFLGPERSVWHQPAPDGTPTVYLTFDDGPNPTATPELLDVLAAHQARATFFVIPRHVTEATAPIVRRMFDEGHAVALHSHTRALMLMQPEDFAAMLTEQASTLERLTTRAPCRLFRPHAGWRGGEMYNGLDRAGYTLAGWSLGMWDWNWWRPTEASSLVSRLVDRASDGDIFVLHDGHHEDPRADRQETVEAISRLVPALRERGFDFATLCPGDGAVSGEVGDAPVANAPPAS